jgi:hypothetical protein
MAKDEKTSAKVAKIASKALRTPDKVSKKEIQSLGGAALTQAPDKKPAKKK